MKIQISTIVIIVILIIATLIGVNLFLQPKEIETIITERENDVIVNNEIKSELEEKIDIDLQEKEQNFENKIDKYISNIYFGTDTYITEFQDINSANEQWIWECAYRNLVNFEELDDATIVSKEDVEISAKQLFGDNLKKEFPKEGLKFWLEPEENGYFYSKSSIESDFYNDYEILSYKRNNKIITVNIVEYKYNEIFLGQPSELNLYKINSDKIVKSYSLNTSITGDNYYNFLVEKYDEARLYVKENPELFSIATITLEYDEQNHLFYIKSKENGKIYTSYTKGFVNITENSNELAAYELAYNENGELIYNENGKLFGWEELLSDGCSTWCSVSDYNVNAIASSTLKSHGKYSYSASNIQDVSRENAWAEGVEGNGVGEYIELEQNCLVGSQEYETDIKFIELCVVNGYAATEKNWNENNRVKELKMYFDNKYVATIVLEDTIKQQYIDISHLNLKVQNGETAKFRFEIKDVYKGTKYDDTCITGLLIEFSGRTAH